MPEPIPLRFDVKTFLLAEGHDDLSDLRDVEVHGRRVYRTAATVTVELRPGEVLSTLDVFVANGPDGGDRLASVPFAIGQGHWVWIEPIVDEDDDP